MANNNTFKVTAALAAVGAVFTGGCVLIGKYLLGKIDNTVVTSDDITANAGGEVKEVGETITEATVENVEIIDNAETGETE
jgi:hypothetical protein